KARGTAAASCSSNAGSANTICSCSSVITLIRLCCCLGACGRACSNGCGDDCAPRAYAAAERGEIPVIKIGRLLRVPVRALERMAGSRQRAGGIEKPGDTLARAARPEERITSMSTIAPRQRGGSALAYVYDGRQCLDHVLGRGPKGFEAFDRDDKSLG